MFAFVTFGPWDIALLLVISLHATGVAYLHDPKHKAAIMTLPIPFTMVSLALGLNVNVTHVVGMLNLLVYTYSVKWLHYKAGLPILAAIAMGVLIDIAVGMAGEQLLPKTEYAFWIAAIFNLSLGGAMHFFRSHAPEPGYRTPLPLHLKLPAIMGVLTMVIFLKRLLGGFAATFPMIGTIASYEMRYSLGAACQAVVMMLILVTPFQIACHLTQGSLGLIGGLMVGWVAWGLMALLFLPRFLKVRPVVEPPVVAGG